MIIYLKLFWEFFKAGLFAIGGGMATVPFLQEISRKTGWYTAGDLADMIAVSESTPGPIGVNMATYVGYTTVSRLFGPVAGILGGILSTVGLVMPSVIIILIVARFLEKLTSGSLCRSDLIGRNLDRSDRCFPGEHHRRMEVGNHRLPVFCAGGRNPDPDKMGAEGEGSAPDLFHHSFCCDRNHFPYVCPALRQTEERLQ